METQQQTRPPVLDSDALLSVALYPDALYNSYVQTHRVWLELYDDTEWEADPRTRRSMLTARLAC